jgi:hypothetical protein
MEPTWLPNDEDDEGATGCGTDADGKVNDEVKDEAVAPLPPASPSELPSPAM